MNKLIIMCGISLLLVGCGTPNHLTDEQVKMVQELCMAGKYYYGI